MLFAIVFVKVYGSLWNFLVNWI